MLQHGQFLQDRSVQLPDGIGSARQHRPQAEVALVGHQFFADIADLGTVSLLVKLIQLRPLGHLRLLPDLSDLLLRGAVLLRFGKDPLPVFRVGHLRVFVDGISHDLLKGQLAPEILHIQVDVQLLIRGQGGRRKAVDLRKAAHGQEEADGPGTVPVLGDTQHCRQQAL